MANTRKRSTGKSVTGKGAGVGAMTSASDATVPENRILSNRDKSLHGRSRGLDSRAVAVEQGQDPAAASPKPAPRTV